MRNKTRYCQSHRAFFCVKNGGQRNCWTRTKYSKHSGVWNIFISFEQWIPITKKRKRLHIAGNNAISSCATSKNTPRFLEYMYFGSLLAALPARHFESREGPGKEVTSLYTLDTLKSNNIGITFNLLILLMHNTSDICTAGYVSPWGCWVSAVDSYVGLLGSMGYSAWDAVNILFGWTAISFDEDKDKNPGNKSAFVRSISSSDSSCFLSDVM